MISLEPQYFDSAVVSDGDESYLRGAFVANEIAKNINQQETNTMSGASSAGDGNQLS